MNNKNYANAMAKNIISQMKTFVSTKNYPSPCYLPFGNEKDDIAAVIAGTKPSAIIHKDEKDLVLKELMKMAINDGFFIKLFEDLIIVSKDKKDIDEIQEIYQKNPDSKEEIAEKSKKLGNKLGYCSEAVKDFTEYGIKKEMTFYHRDIRRKLNNE